MQTLSVRVLSSSAQWQTAHAVAGHSGQFCDMAPLSGTPRVAEPIVPHTQSPVTPGTLYDHGSNGPDQWHTARRRAYLPHARSKVTPGMFATRFQWLGIGVRIMRAELTYGDEKHCDILRLSQSFLWKSDFFRVISLIFCVKRLASLHNKSTTNIWML